MTLWEPLVPSYNPQSRFHLFLRKPHIFFAFLDRSKLIFIIDFLSKEFTMYNFSTFVAKNVSLKLKIFCKSLESGRFLYIRKSVDSKWGPLKILSRLIEKIIIIYFWLVFCSLFERENENCEKIIIKDKMKKTEVDYIRQMGTKENHLKNIPAPENPIVIETFCGNFTVNQPANKTEYPFFSKHFFVLYSTALGKSLKLFVF
jgi:hypothetical protein